MHGQLVLSSQPARKAHWAQNIWENPVVLEIDSINDATNKLKSLQHNGCLYSHTLHRRAKLILEKLSPVNSKSLNFPPSLPQVLSGTFTLLDENTLLLSTKCSSPFPNGEAYFVEDKKGPPNRAYFKAL